MGIRNLLSKTGLVRPEFPTLPRGCKTEADLMRTDGNRLSPWRHDSYAKPLTLEIRSHGIGDEVPSDPRPYLTELPPNWKKLPNGLYQYTLPVDLRLTVEDFYYGENASFKGDLRAAKLTSSTSSTRFLMSADKIALNLYHYMKRCIPGFDAINGQKGYNANEFWKAFNIVVPNWGTIRFYNFGGDLCAPNGGLLQVVKTANDTTTLLLEPLKRQRPGIDGDRRQICYEGDEAEPHVGFNLPKDTTTVDNIITVFAVVHAIYRCTPKWEDPRGEWNPYPWL